MPFYIGQVKVYYYVLLLITNANTTNMLFPRASKHGRTHAENEPTAKHGSYGASGNKPGSILLFRYEKVKTTFCDVSVVLCTFFYSKCQNKSDALNLHTSNPL